MTSLASSAAASVDSFGFGHYREASLSRGSLLTLILTRGVVATQQADPRPCYREHQRQLL